MAPKYQHESRANRKNIFGDLYDEEDEHMGEMYAQFLMLSLLASNDGG